MSKPDKKFVAAVRETMDYLAQIDSGNGYADSESAIRINEAICKEVAQDVWDTADRNGFSEGDVHLAIGRVLCKRLGIPEC